MLCEVFVQQTNMDFLKQLSHGIFKSAKFGQVVNIHDESTRNIREYVHALPRPFRIRRRP